MFSDFILEIRRNYSVWQVEIPNLRCSRVLHTREHLKFGHFPPLAEELQLDNDCGWMSGFIAQKSGSFIFR